MIDVTYDPEADAAYITLGRGQIDGTEEAGPFIYDVDAEGLVIGIEILSPAKCWPPALGRRRDDPARGAPTRRSDLGPQSPLPARERSSPSAARNRVRVGSYRNRNGFGIARISRRRAKPCRQSPPLR
jgi:uncharacterized protein YuzE